MIYLVKKVNLFIITILLYFNIQKKKKKKKG